MTTPQTPPDNPPAVADAILSAKWSLQILRALLHGPARFSGIRASIPAISANILAGRLRTLEEAGIIHRTTLPPPADCQVYALTDLGAAVRPVLRAIDLWGSLFPRGQAQPGDGEPQR
ncbi:helix-turn-helix domain-containing protein [Sphingobium sp. AN558]|uniref:winged helix-turn-helix transcriptional regulator n=1 Tax=Sphingobium sp. AN558 TaxID=3133442 RepID=UPI0030C2E90E